MGLARMIKAGACQFAGLLALGDDATSRIEGFVNFRKDAGNQRIALEDPAYCC